jgi:hypothetical protein
MSKGLGSLAEGAAEKNNLFRWIIIFFGGFASWRFRLPHKEEGSRNGLRRLDQDEQGTWILSRGGRRKK